MPLDDRGWEVLDDTPIAKPAKFRGRVSTLDEMRAMINHINAEARQQGVETFDEADDFDVEDDPVPSSRFEIPIDNAYDSLAPSPPPLATGAPGASLPPSPPPGHPAGSPAPVPSPSPAPSSS